MKGGYTASKWLFWIGVILFVPGLATFSFAQPVALLMPVLLMLPYLYVNVRKGMDAGNAPSE